MWITSCMCRMTHLGSKRAGFASDSARPRRPESGPRVDVSRVPPSIRPRAAQGQVPSATFTFRTPGSAPVWREEVARPEGFERAGTTIGLGLVVAAPSIWSLLGWAVLFCAVASTLGQLFVLPQHVTAWEASRPSG
jgi:hypothetical protein